MRSEGPVRDMQGYCCSVIDERYCTGTWSFGNRVKGVHGDRSNLCAGARSILIIYSTEDQWHHWRNM